MCAASTLEVMTLSPEIHEYPTHQLSAYTEELRAVLPVHSLDINQFEVGLIDEGRSLQSVVGTLCRHVSACHFV